MIIVSILHIERHSPITSHFGMPYCLADFRVSTDDSVAQVATLTPLQAFELAVASIAQLAFNAVLYRTMWVYPHNLVADCRNQTLWCSQTTTAESTCRRLAVWLL